MKNILAINTANTGGGAENVGYSLSKELYLRGYESRMLVHRVDYSADELAPRIVSRMPGSGAMYSLGRTMDEWCSTHALLSLPALVVPAMEVVRRTDLIHLHNMHGYYFNIFAIPFLMWQKPLVWTFHDMWPITGKCVWAFGCDRFMQSCGNCPQLSYYPAVKRDTSRGVLRLKKLLYARPKFVIVTPSAWLQSHVARSILKDVPSFVVPSPVDTKLFYPEDKRQARDRLGIPPDKKVVLFVASWINTIPHKGVEAFKEMIATLASRRDDIFAIVVGHLQGTSVLQGICDGKETGWIQDPDLLRSHYAAADVFVSPTMAENSSCTIMEAMASGTATVAYATGGVPEQILHGRTGWLIEPGNRRDLFEGVLAVLKDDDQRAAFGAAAARHASANYAMDVFVNRYLNVYQQAVALKQSGVS
jgi:glycosyltransferase involved in cell wall biosynthesis